MSARRLTIALAPIVVAAALFTLLPNPGAAGDARCDGSAADKRLSSGRGTVAVANRRLVVVDARESCDAPRPSSDAGMLRHVTAEPGEGTAFVDDAAGHDSLVVIAPGGTSRIDAGGEVTHPAWSHDGNLVWSEDMRRLVVREPNGTTTIIGAPRRAAAIFSPEFQNGALIAVIAEQGGGPAEDAGLDNLWRQTKRGWHPLTHFDVRGDRWSAIRTPVVAPDGTLLFVRVHGRWRKTRAPSFELWRLRDRKAAKVAELPGEMFLAGFDDGRLVWNALTEKCGGWELLVETDGPLRSLGCGAVEVDPVDVGDPDLSRGAEPEVNRAPYTPPDVAVVIGDFGRRSQAERVARRVGAGADVVTNETAPTAVRPGVFAVAVPVAPDVAGAALTDLRVAYPSLARSMYLAPI